MNLFNLKKYLLFILICISAPAVGTAQNNLQALAMADTTRFSVNQSGGWELYNSWINPVGADSIRIELILQHANNINWNEFQYVGSLRQLAFAPTLSRTAELILVQRSFLLRLDPDGKCYLRQTIGLPPEGSMAVIPVNIQVKK